MTKRKSQSTALPEMPDLREARHVGKKIFKPLNDSQKSYTNKINNNIITFGIGPAGTGKTFCAAMAAAKAFDDKKIEKIIITRPLVEAGEKMGFLPGDLNEKIDPYVRPFADALSRIMGSGHVEALIANRRIEFMPLAFMRGQSWDNTFVVLDEAQNVTKTQMKLFLTRIGKGTTVVVDGDLTQKDIPVYGLDDAIRRLAFVKGVAVHEFTQADIVRSGIVHDIIVAYSNPTDDSLDKLDDTEGLERFIANS